MEKLNLIELYKIKNRMIREGINNIMMYHDIIKAIQNKENMILEDTSSTGGPAVSGGMGAVVSAQPSGLAGSTIGPNWASSGGSVGSGDISVPYNPSGSNRVFQKIPTPMGKNHGPKTGKKSRVKKLDLKSLRDVFAKRQDFTDNQGENKGKKKVLDFNDFLKNDFTTIKK
jgi:hypothetical protein